MISLLPSPISLSPSPISQSPIWAKSISDLDVVEMLLVFSVAVAALLCFFFCLKVEQINFILFYLRVFLILIEGVLNFF